MITKNCLNLRVILAVALPLCLPTASAQYVDSLESLSNRAIAASPRAKEAFPWLSRDSGPSTQTRTTKATARNELTEARKNRALALSPRLREIYPELARQAAPEGKLSIASQFMVPDSVRNNAIALSPRAREEYPALAR